MDTPICVFDAQTLVDHIHEIKAWFYGGHLRLVVPISTSENVEQLYKKSVEPKPTTQEAARPKSAGKQAKKVHPAFDVNPTIAREFLARLQKGKEGEQYVKERPLYREDEKWDAVQFQTLKEEYTPWKGVLVEEEEVEVPDDRPLSWAELAKKKLYANGNADKSQPSKGPVKPKLVSKASGNDLQPWKVQKNAPTISAREVPGQLRPLMSCALWRLHESIDRNDANQLFLLSDQEEIRVVARKLNVTVRTTRELGKKLTASLEKDDLNVMGMLEKENLADPQADAKVTISASISGVDNIADQVVVPSPDVALLSRVENPRQKDGVNGMSSVGGPEDGVQQNHTDEQSLNLEKASETVHEETSPHVPSDHPVKPILDPKDLVQGLLKPPSSQDQVQHTAESNDVQSDIKRVHKLQPAADIRESSLDKARTEVLTSATAAAEPTAVTAKHTVSTDQESQEDSDEEVVVFVPNPKRMSAQKKSLASSSRPSTAQGDTPASSPMQPGPRNSSPSAQGVPKAIEHVSPQAQRAPHKQPRPLSSGTIANDPKQSPSHTKSNSSVRARPLSSGPTLIDPDAFGRGLPVNAGGGTLANVGSSKKPRQHSPRTSMQSASHNNGAAPTQNSPRTSPSRHKPGRSPRPSTRALPQKVEDAPQANIPVISHQAYTRAPLVAPNSQGPQKSRFGAIGPPSKSSTNLRPSAASRETDVDQDAASRINPIRRPRSAHGSSSFGNATDGSRHQALGTEPFNNGSPASRRGGHRNERSSRPSLFEPELDRTGAPAEANFERRTTNMPEVQYTLKSGTTREAARGKGKLWVG